MKYLYHWPLFILVLILSFAGAYEYLQITNPAYEVYATILVKDEKKSPDDKPLLRELNQTSSPKNAETEIQILTSKKLIGNVVNNLQLWTAYSIEDGMKSEDIYQTTPFRFVLKEKNGILSAQKINVTIKDSKSFTILNAGGQQQIQSFNSSILAKFGTWTLTPTKFLLQYIGSTVTIKIDDSEKVAAAYTKSLDAHLLDKATPTIGLFVTDDVPERGENFLNSLIKEYNEASAAEEKRTTKSTIDFIDNRLASLTGELSSAEKDVEGYTSSQGLTDISSQSKAYIENVQGNDAKLNDVNVQLNVIDGIERYVNATNNESPPATIGITDPSLNSSIEKLSQLQLKRVALLATTPETNPIFEPINKQIAITKGAIKQTIQGIKTSLVSQKKGLLSFNAKSQSSIKNIPGQERQFVDMKRQQSIKENLYVYLLQKREELSLSYASNFVDARIVDAANLGDIKWPKKSVIYLVALLVGLGLPFFIIYFRHSFNRSITDRRDIENGVDVPIMGELSYQKTDNSIVVLDKSRSIISEQFRSLRTNLNHVYTTTLGAPANTTEFDHNGRVTLFTSSVSGEGKSFVSTNLAAAFATTGKKAIILEMDLRRPKVSSMFNISPDHAGISEFLLGKKTLAQIIQPSGIVENLDIIGAGEMPHNPAELLEYDTLDQLINQLKQKYDVIIIDSPPLHLVTDAMIIGRVVDLSIYVMRQGKTGIAELKFLEDVYEEGKLPNMNIIFNGITQGKYGYGYRYDNTYYTAKKPKQSFSGAFKLFLSRF